MSLSSAFNKLQKAKKDSVKKAKSNADKLTKEQKRIIVANKLNKYKKKMPSFAKFKALKNDGKGGCKK